MFLEQRTNFFNPPQFNLSTNTVLGTTQRWAIDRTWPIEAILICVNFDLTTAADLTSPATPDQYDNFMQILQKVNLSVNDGRQPRSLVDCPGVALLEYAAQTGWNLDTATQQAIAFAQNQNSTGFPVGRHQITYPIFCAPPGIGEPLRTRCYLPVHTYPQDPVLTLQFNTAAALSAANPGVVGTVRVDVVLIRRVPTPQSEALLRSTPGSNPNGYLDWDLIETPFSLPLNSAVEARLPIPVPGNYLNLLFRQYKGGTTYSRTVPVDVDVGDTIANNMGLETRWRLETGLVVLREWRWKHLRIINDLSKPQVVPFVTPAFTSASAGPYIAVASAGSPTTALVVRSTTFPTPYQGTLSFFRAGTSALLDFLNDGITGDSGNELGSLLDCNTPANNGLKMEVIGTPASVATNASVINVMGHRIFGDVSRWQKF